MASSPRKNAGSALPNRSRQHDNAYQRLRNRHQAQRPHSCWVTCWKGSGAGAGAGALDDGTMNTSTICIYRRLISPQSIVAIKKPFDSSAAAAASLSFSLLSLLSSVYRAASKIHFTCAVSVAKINSLTQTRCIRYTSYSYVDARALDGGLLNARQDQAMFAISQWLYSSP